MAAGGRRRLSGVDIQNSFPRRSYDFREGRRGSWYPSFLTMRYCLGSRRRPAIARRPEMEAIMVYTGCLRPLTDEGAGGRAARGVLGEKVAPRELVELDSRPGAEARRGCLLQPEGRRRWKKETREEGKKHSAWPVTTKERKFDDNRVHETAENSGYFLESLCALLTIIPRL